MNQNYKQINDEVVVGQIVYYWREKGAGILQKQKWRGKRMKYAIMSWRSFKLMRVCWSLLSAESQACATAVDELYVTEVFYSLLLNPHQDLRSDETAKRAGESIVVVDARALYDKRSQVLNQQGLDQYGFTKSRYLLISQHYGAIVCS